MRTFYNLTAYSDFIFYSEGEYYGCLSFLWEIGDRFARVSGEKKTNTLDADTIIGNGFSMPRTIFFSYVAMKKGILLVRLITEYRSANHIFHRVILVTSSDSENGISASGIVIGFLVTGTIIITQIDSLFPNITGYQFGDISDIFLNYPHNLQSFIDL